MENSVKTAISIKKALFDQADQMAQKMKISRSNLIALALENYLKQQQNRALFDQMNAAYADAPDPDEKLRLSKMRKKYRKLVEGTW